jgi:hypothetical protein
MERIEGVSQGSTLLARLIFFLSRRSYGRVISPARVYALDSGLLLAVGLMAHGSLSPIGRWGIATSSPLLAFPRRLSLLRSDDHETLKRISCRRGTRR